MLIRISDTKAFRIERIKMEKDGPELLSIRQLYATKNDPKFKPGRQGVTFNIEGGEAKRVVRALKKALVNEEGHEAKLIVSTRGKK